VHDVELKVGELEQHKRAEDPATDEEPQRACGGGAEPAVGGAGRHPTEAGHEADGQERHQRERDAPAEPGADRRRDNHGAREHADPAGDRPAVHRQIPLGWLDVHERRLGEAHERAGRRIEDTHRDEDRKRRAGCREGQEACGKGDAARDHHEAAMARVAEDTERRLDDRGHQGRQRQRQTQLGVREPEIAPDRRQRHISGAKDQLVEELDRKERRAERERPPAQRCGSPGRERHASKDTGRGCEHGARVLYPGLVERRSGSRRSGSWHAHRQRRCEPRRDPVARCRTPVDRDAGRP
jgi:hypothetical protein